MKKVRKLIGFTSIVLALLFVIQTPISAIASVINSSAFVGGQYSLLDFAGTSEKDESSNMILGELSSERTEYSKSFRLENGNNMVVQYNLPIHYRSTDNQWQDFDFSMVSSQKEISVLSSRSTPDEADESERKVDVYSAKDSSLSVSFAKEPAAEGMVFFESGENTISWNYTGINRTSAKVVDTKTEHEGNDRYTVLDNLTGTVRYESAFPSVDIECISFPLGVKENVILWDKTAQNSFSIVYQIGNLSAEQLNEKTIALINANEDVVHYITAPYMSDADNKASEDVKLLIMSQEDGQLTVNLSANTSWLADENRNYPVTIDPWFTTGQQWGAVQCAFLDKSHPNTAYGYGSSTGYTGTIYVGGYENNSDTYRALIKMNTLPSLNKGDMIVDATINLIPFNVDYTQDMYVGIYEPTSTWSQDTVTWNNKPAYSDIMLDYSNMYTDLVSNSYYSWNITKLVKQWYNGSPNNGFYLISSPSLSYQQTAGYYSSNYPSGNGIRPIFALTYRNNKGIEDYWSTTSFSVGNAGTVYVNDYSGSLTFVTSMGSTASPIMPAGINYVYNSYMAKEKYNKSSPYTGRGWRMSIQQTLKPSSEYNLSGDAASTFPYVYTDADGTEHYFYKKTEGGTTKYFDEDGLDLELTISNNDNEKYTITDKDKNKLIFNSSGILRIIKDKSNNEIKINGSYDDFRIGTNIVSICDASGFALTFELNDNSYIKKIFDPAGRYVSVSHSTIGDTGAFISRITRPDGTQTDFTYDSDGLMTSITDTDGYHVTISYDNSPSKKVTQIVEYGANNAVGNKITFDRSTYNTTIIQSSGIDGIWNNDDDHITTYQFDNYGRTISVQGKTKAGKDLGASAGEYSAGEPNSTGSNVKYTNRLTKQHSLGGNTVNLMRNHSFEDTESWTYAAWGSGSNTFTGNNTTSQCLYGQKSYCINSTAYTGTSAARAYQDITGLTAGKTYTLSGYVKITSITGNSGDSGALINVTPFISNTAQPGFSSEIISSVTDSSINNGWRRLSVTFTVPDNTTKTRVNIALKAATGTAYFDAMQLEEAETESSYNLIENSSLESSSGATPTSWLAAGDINLSASGDTITTEEHQEGTSSFRIIGDLSLNKGITQVIPVSGTEDDTYIVSGWAKADAVPISSTDRKFKLTITVDYTDNTTKTKQSADFNPSISEWQYVSKAFTLDDGNANTNKTPKQIRIGINYSKQANTAYFDNVSLVKEPVASYTYDNEGNLISVSANAQQKSTLEYNADDQVTKSVDPKGGEYTYTYDSMSRLSTATTQSGAQYTYSYDDQGHAEQVEGVITEGGTTTKIKSMQTISYPPSAVEPTYTVTNWDTRRKDSSATYNAQTGTLLETEDANNTVTGYSYNTDNDLLTSVSSGGNTVSYTYDNNFKYLKQITTPSETDYYFFYDSFGNRTKTKVGSRTLATYLYSDGGALTEMHYGNNTIVEYSYDEYGNVKEKEIDNNTVYQGIADNTGAITKEIDVANGLQYSYNYDTTDRLIGTTVLDTNTNTRKAEFEYDYDLNNNVTKLATATSSGTGSVTYSYGDDNLLTQTILPNNKQLNYTYDKFGRLTSSDLNATNNIGKTYTYIKTASYGTQYTSLVLETETIGTDTYKYEYDGVGNITSISKKAQGQTAFADVADYTYDSLNQLLTAIDYENNRKYVYTYLPGGNIQQEKIYSVSGNTETLISTNSYTYGDSSWGDLLKKYKNQDITYDTIGNPLTYRDGISFTWTNGRQLASYNDGTTGVAYTYGSDGMRLSKTVGNIQYTYLYLGGLLMQETRGSRILDYFYDANGQAIAVRYKSNANAAGTYYYYAYNWRGDIVGLYAENGAPECTYTYDAWGKLLSVKNPAGTEMTSATYIGNLQSLKYRGYVYDRETGLYYLQSRYYDPVTRRFINADALVSTGTGVSGYNMFSYCNNNPIIFFDSNGKDAIILHNGDYVVGHIGALIQDADGNWYHFYYGAKNPIDCILSILFHVNIPEYKSLIRYNDGLLLADINNSNIYSDGYDGLIYLDGDFSASLDIAKNYDESYNIYDNNCATVTLSILSKSYTIYKEVLEEASSYTLPSYFYMLTVTTKLAREARKNIPICLGGKSGRLRMEVK